MSRLLLLWKGKSFRIFNDINTRSFLLLVFLFCAVTARSNIFQVTTTADAGPGSLRQAIISANAAGAGPHSIQFLVSGVINVTSSLPALTVSGVTIDGGGTVTVSGPGGDVTVYLFLLGAGANNTTIRNLTVQNTGVEPIRITGTQSGITLENLVLRQTGTGIDYLNHAILVEGPATNFTFRNITITDVQDGYWGLRFVNTVNGLLIDGLSITNGAGTSARGIQFENVSQNITIKNALIDMDDPATADDGDYGIYFNTTATNVTIDSLTMHDAEIYGIFIGSTATNVNIKHAVLDNFDGYVGTQMIRFNNGASAVTLDSVIINMDLNNTLDDGNYALVFDGIMQNVTITKSTFREADVLGIYIGGIDHDNITFSNNIFDKNGSGGDGQGGLRFIDARNTTSDGGPVLITGNTFSDNSGEAIGVYNANYTLPDFTISNNTIYGTRSAFGAINVQGPDKVVITQNSIYNNDGLGIELTAAGNCGYEGVANTPVLVSSSLVSGNTYDLTMTLPAVCATGCNVEIYTTPAGVKGTGGQYYVTTLTGVLNGTSTHTITSATPPVTSIPWGTWTATLRNTTNNCGTSEFSNRLAIRVNGPAGVNTGINLWLRPDQVDAGNMINGTGWQDFSGNNRNFDMVFGDPARVDTGLNFNYNINFDGNDYLRSTASPFVNTFTSGEAITVTKVPVTNGNWGNPYDFGSSSRGSHYTWGNAAIYNGFGTNQRLGWNPLTKTIVEGKTGVASITGNPVDVKNWNIFSTHSATGNWGVDFNGQTVVSTTTNTTSFALAAGNEHVGAVSGAVFNGNIAEQILYNRVLSSIERQRIDSYLGVKYGLTLFHDYVASDGTTVWWSLTGNTGYNNDIAGLARDNVSVLHQKQSRSVNSDDMVTMGVGSKLFSINYDNNANIATDHSALMWGNNDGATTFSVNFVSVYSTVRMGRVWKVDKTNWTDTTVIIKLKNGTPNKTLLISADPTFASGVQLFPLNDTGAVVLNSSILTDGIYFTFATRIVGPGCVNIGIAAWWKADNGASGAEWNDYSGNNIIQSQSVEANQPTMVTDAANFNPALDFDAVNDFMTSPSVFGTGSVQNISFFAVTVPDAPGDALFAERASNGDYVRGYAPFSNGNVYFDAPYGYRIFGPWGGTYGLPHMFEFVRKPSGVSMEALVNNRSVASSSATLSNFNGTNSTFLLGAQPGFLYNGKIAEFVVYKDNSLMTATDRLKIQSYLALKYGITLDQTTPTDYLASDGNTIMWDASDNTIYNKNIAGLGKDTCDGLHQRQSRSVNANALVTIALGDVIAPGNLSNAYTVTNNLSFFTWGNDGGTTLFNTAVSGAIVTTRMNRVWKVDKTNWADQNITIKLNGDVLNTYLIISSSDPAFGTIDQEIAIGIADSAVHINSSLLTDGAYFTFAKQIVGPGCVTQGVYAWLRGDIGYNVNDWTDYSGNNRGGTLTAGVMGSSTLNFNPAPDFNPTSFYTLPFSMTPNAVTGLPNLTVFAVINADATLGSIVGNDDGGGDDRNFYMDALLPGGQTTGGLNVTGQTKIGSAVWQQGVANGTFAYLDGRLASTSTVNANVNGPATAWLGRGWNGGRPFDGRIAEFVMYNKHLTAADRNKVESYLALKYGVTLDQTTPTDYTASDGTIMWQASANVGYTSNIAGIGRNDCTSLNQKQSKSANPGTLITIALGDAVAPDNASNTGSMQDLSFFTWGNNNGATSFSTAVTGLPNATVRMNRIWKVDKTANWSDQNITFKIEQSGERYLLIDSDDPYFDAGTTTEYVINAGTGSVTINTSDIPDGAYFTIATKIVGPGCVNAGIQTWLRADYAATGSNWADFSGNQASATQVAAASQPALAANGINFGPAVDFDGSNDFMTIPLNINSTTANPITTFTVYNADVTSVNSRALWGNDDGGFDRFMKLELVSANNADAAYTGGNIAGRTLLNSSIMNDGPANGSFMYINNGQVLNFTQANSAGGTVTTNLANWGGTAGYFDGKIAEQIFYNRALDATERLRVSSYLALKYGITLSQVTPTDYLASNGITTMWKASDNTGYGKRITGIGRDDCDNLYQKQSLSTDTGTVTVAVGAIIAATNQDNTAIITNDNSYFVFSDDGASTQFATIVSGIANVNFRMTRIFKVDKTNWADQEITLQLAGGNSTQYLIVSTDAVFDGSDAAYQLDASGNAVVNTSAIQDGGYFTFASFIVAPGCVAAPTVWLKANDGVTANGSGQVSNWADVSGNGHNATQATVANQPIVLDGKINFNPALDFDGSNDNLLMPATGLASGVAARTGIVVASTEKNPFAGTFSYGGAAATQNVTFSMTHANGSAITSRHTGVAGDAVAAGFPLNWPPVIQQGSYNGTQLEARINGGAIATSTFAISTGLTQAYVGTTNAFPATEVWDGKIAEVIFYNRTLSNTELQNVNTYLAIKYGITLNHNYTSNGSVPVLWDVTGADAAYSSTIAGIWRNDCSDLYQRQSRSVIDTANGITIALASVKLSNSDNTGTLDNEDFLVWGANGTAAYTFNATYNGVAARRLNRVWKIRDHGNAGQVQLAIPKASLLTAGAPGACEAYKLVVSNSNTDPAANWDNTNSTEYTLSEQTINGTVCYVTNVTFAADADRYFTIGRLLDKGAHPYLVSDGTQTATADECETTDWIYFLDPADDTRRILAIKKNGNNIDINDFTVRVDVTTDYSDPITSALGKAEPTGYQQALFLMRRLVEINYSPAAGHSIVAPLQVRMYWDDGSLTLNEKQKALDNLNALIAANGITVNSGPVFQWFKAGGQDIPTMLANLKPSGIHGNGDQSWDELASANHIYGLDGNVPYVEFNNITSFSVFGGGWFVNQVDNVILPVHFIGFTATKVDKKVSLDWEVSAEENVKGYYIQRSANGINWTDIGFVNAKPQAPSNKYSFIDAQPLAKRNYYRIREEDIDGHVNYSVTRTVLMDKDEWLVKLYPVPVRDRLKLDMDNVESHLTIKISDVNGRVLLIHPAQLTRGSGLEEIDVSSLAGGIYFIEISGDKKRWTGKFIKEN